MDSSEEGIESRLIRTPRFESLANSGIALDNPPAPTS